MSQSHRENGPYQKEELLDLGGSSSKNFDESDRSLNVEIINQLHKRPKQTSAEIRPHDLSKVQTGSYASVNKSSDELEDLDKFSNEK